MSEQPIKETCARCGAVGWVPNPTEAKKRGMKLVNMIVPDDELSYICPDCAGDFKRWFESQSEEAKEKMRRECYAEKKK